MSTDEAWRRWGLKEPFFAVLTDPRYRRENLNAELLEEFFETGRHHALHVLHKCRELAGADFRPSRALDFGCGVGRVTIALALNIESVTGLDVSPAMLNEARVAADRHGVRNIEWLVSDDALSAVAGHFDLIHSCITFQHIEVHRGRILFARLVGLLSPGGVGAIHVTYAKERFMSRFGQPPAQVGQLGLQTPGQKLDDPTRDPEMQMNAYNLGELAFVLQACGIDDFRCEFTDHGGEWGAFLYFRKPTRS